MLYILGQFLVRTNDALDSVMVLPKPVSFQMTITPEELTAIGFGFDEAPIQDLDSATVKESFVLTTTQQSIDELDLQFLLNQQEGTISSISLPFTKKVTVPSSSPYTVTETGLTVDQDVVATVLSDTTPKFLKRIASAGTVAANEFEVTADTLTFHSGQAGATVVINYMKSQSNLPVIGGTNAANPFDTNDMSLTGLIKGTRTTKRFYAPRVKRTGERSIAVSNQIQDASFQYKMLTPSGWSVPFAIWDAA